MEMIYAIINMAGMYICFACCMIVAAQRPSYGQKYLMMTNVCAFIISVADALEFFAHSQGAAMVAVKMAYVGKMHTVVRYKFYSGWNEQKDSLGACVL